MDKENLPTNLIVLSSPPNAATLVNAAAATNFNRLEETQPSAASMAPMLLVTPVASVVNPVVQR